MKVIKRSGRHEDVKFDQITDRLKMLSSDLDIDPIKVARSVCAQIKDFITTRELDELSATICSSLSIQEPAYDILGTRILISSHEKDTPENFVDVIRCLQENKDVVGDPSPILDASFASFVLDNADLVNEHFRNCRKDFPLYQMSLFGWKTLHRSYLLQSNRKCIERPEHLFYRVALALHFPNMERTRSSYQHLSSGNFIHATPTLFHAGTKRPQLSSCFLTTSTDDVDGIYRNISNVAKISKWAGGIGVHISHIRSKNSYIRGTNGFSNGIMPMLRVYNDTSRYIDQCVLPTTPVYTLNGPKPICSLEPKKDWIFQKNGRYELLDKKLEHVYNGDILNVLMEDGTTFSITPSHPIYGRQSIDFESHIPNDTCWIDMEDIRIGDELAFPIPSYTVDQDDFRINTIFCWGLLLGWGQLNPSNPHVDILFPVQTPKTVIETFQYFLSTNMIHFMTYLQNDIVHLRFKTSNHFPIKYHHLYDYNRNRKRIHPSILHLPISKLRYFIHAFIFSHTSSEDTKLYASRQCIILDVSSYDENIYESIFYVCTKIGIRPSKFIHDIEDDKRTLIAIPLRDLETCGMIDMIDYVDYVNEENPTNTSSICQNVSEWKTVMTSKMMKTPLSSSDNLVHLKIKTNASKFVYKKVLHIQKEHYNGLLYDLEFENEHNYGIGGALIHNGGGKRKGSFAMYLEPWHADIYDFVFAKRNVGNEDERARDLFYGLWIPDLFMKRVEMNGKWSLMCPNICQGLVDSYGKEFENRYIKYEEEGKYVRQIDARDLWKEILHSQIETGLPYMLYKDSCNSKSNQKNIGTIRSSNLCCEIIEYSDSNEYSVCNLASINLSNCIKQKDFSKLESLTIFSKKLCFYCMLLKRRLDRLGISYVDIDVQDNPSMYEKMMEGNQQEKTVPKILVGNETTPYGFNDFWNKYVQPDFDFEELQNRVGVLVVNMNQIIEKNFYPTPETERSNRRHRPIGIGVQGLADLFCKLYIPFDSDKARALNRKIFETMYFSALKTSHKYAIEQRCVYETFQGSPLSQGIFHFELCSNFERETLFQEPKYDWNKLRREIMIEGVANSLFIAPMPTASTSQILYQNECFEPFTSNLYVRRTLAGEYTIFNKYLVQDLRDVNMWNQETIDHLIVNRGSIQNFTKLPATIRHIYRTAWEIPQKSLIDMAAERQWFIDQSQSFNLFVADPSLEKLTKIHFYGWKRGLKTGSYYIRTKPQHFSQNFTIDPTKEQEITCDTCSA